ncbi:right-handed parallel beta-helix repeat-containing protein [Cohnella sp. GCM10027633]|uniref:right-handed parallel beta-helix repeat-containing protein n=1 Tax=unclassified Cohnella TaxID=2636738 RepID=UPI0036361609
MRRKWLKWSTPALLATAVILGGLPVQQTASALVDTTPPASSAMTPGDVPTETLSSFYVKLSWTAPADDGSVIGSGNAAKYDLRYSTSTLNATNFWKAKEVPFVPIPGTPGSTQWKTVSGLEPSTTYYFGLRTTDDAGNQSAISYLTVTTTAQSCAYTLPPGDTITRLHGTTGTSTTTVKYIGDMDGKVVCLQNTTRTEELEFRDFVGDADKPIKIVNIGGQFIINTSNAGYGMKFTGAEHIQLSGNGVPGLYGIKISAAGPALQLKSGSTFYEINHVHIASSNTVGMQLHSDLSCAAPGAADDYSRTGFVQEETVVRDNLIENVGGEGIYLGNSHYDQVMQLQCNPAPAPKTNKLEHAVIGVRVYNNKTNNTGLDGIQVGGAPQDVKVYNNSVKFFATDNERNQRTGIQINPGTTGDVYNNYVTNGTGHGIMYLGRGDSSIFNNFVEASSDAGIYVDKKPDLTGTSAFTQGNIYVMNNTIKDVGTFGIEMRNDVAPVSFMKNNFILMTGIGSLFNIYDNNGILIQTGNKDYYKNNAGGFDTISSNTMIPTSGPPYAIVNNGEDLSAYGVTFDFFYNPRPLSGGFDRGYLET